MRPWRVLRTGECRGAMQMALDEAILVARSRGHVPNTLRLYSWRPPAVTIGYFQSRDKEIDTAKARELGIDVIRRSTGGGAVFHEHEVTYSIVLAEDAVPQDICASYEVICAGIVTALSKLGLAAAFHPVNDVLVNGRKISGSAQTRKQGIVLQHGTVLCDVNLRKMFSVLKVSDEKLKDKMIRAAEERVTSVQQELKRTVSYGEVEEALIHGFQKAFNTAFADGSLTEEELAIAHELCEKKYATPAWNEMR